MTQFIKGVSKRYPHSKAFFFQHGWKGLLSFLFLAIVSSYPPAMMPWHWSLNILIPILVTVLSILQKSRARRGPELADAKSKDNGKFSDGITDIPNLLIGGIDLVLGAIRAIFK